MAQGRPAVQRGALKFFLIGVLSSAILLFGMSLVYGTTGESTFEGIRRATAAVSGESAFVLGVLFVLAGFGFKVAAVPFHFWAPDTYQGAPSPWPPTCRWAPREPASWPAHHLLLGLRRGAGHLGARPVDPGRPDHDAGQPDALRQTNVVRLLGYSSIAHAGFMLVPFAMAAAFEGAALQDAFFGSLTYLLVYAFMNLGAFAAVIAVAERTGSGRSTTGPAWRAIPRAGHVARDVLLLARRDPAAGRVVRQVRHVQGGAGRRGQPLGIALAVVAALNAVIALFFYARVLKVAFMDPPPESLPQGASLSRPLAAALVITAAVVLAAGFYPQMLAFFGEAARALALP